MALIEVFVSYLCALIYVSTHCAVSNMLSPIHVILFFSHFFSIIFFIYFLFYCFFFSFFIALYHILFSFAHGDVSSSNNDK